MVILVLAIALLGERSTVLYCRYKVICGPAAGVMLAFEEMHRGVYTYKFGQIKKQQKWFKGAFTTGFVKNSEKYSDLGINVACFPLMTILVDLPWSFASCACTNMHHFHDFAYSQVFMSLHKLVTKTPGSSETRQNYPRKLHTDVQSCTVSYILWLIASV